MDTFDIASKNEQSPFPETPEQLMEPFISATCTTLGEMASSHVVAGPAVWTQLVRTMNGVSAVVRLAGSADRFLVVTFPLPTAAALATRMLPALVETQQLDEGLIGDCVGEIGNVIAGQAKALLAETRHRFAMSLPEIVVGANHELLAKSSLQCLLVPFTSDLGEFTVQLIAEA